MSNPLFLWFKQIYESWVKLMCAIVGLLLSVLGWFFVPDVTGLRPFVIGAGVLSLLLASYLVWLDEHNKLIQSEALINTLRVTLEKERNNTRPALQGVIEDFDIRPNSPADNWVQVVVALSFHNVHSAPALIRDYRLRLVFSDKTYGALTMYHAELCIDMDPNGYRKTINLASRVGSTVSQDEPIDGYLVFSVGGIPQDMKPDDITVKVLVGYEGAEFVLEYRPTREAGANRVYFCGEPLTS